MLYINPEGCSSNPKVLASPSWEALRYYAALETRHMSPQLVLFFKEALHCNALVVCGLERLRLWWKSCLLVATLDVARVSVARMLLCCCTPQVQYRSISESWWRSHVDDADFIPLHCLCCDAL